jgi:hypothetical protein
MLLALRSLDRYKADRCSYYLLDPSFQPLTSVGIHSYLLFSPYQTWMAIIRQTSPMDPLWQIDDDILHLLLRYGLLDLGHPDRGLGPREISDLALTALELQAAEHGAFASRRLHDRSPSPHHTLSADASGRQSNRRGQGPTEQRASATATESLDDESDIRDSDHGPCTACITTSRHMTTLPCGHRYCRACIAHMIRSGLRDEASWPPRCCAPLSEAAVRWADLHPETASTTGSPESGGMAGAARPELLLERWRARAEEMAAPRRVYCSNAACGLFMPARRHAKVWEADSAGAGRTRRRRRGAAVVAACEACGQQTCALCGTEAHGTGPCPEDREAERLRRTMEMHGWSSCGRCNSVVSLEGGCNHIT